MNTIKVTNLRTEYLSNPLGIDVPAPRLAWRLESSGRAQRQTAYQLLVATSAEALGQSQGDVWDSGKIESDASIQVAYSGAPLMPSGRYYWKARVWDQDGEVSPWSETVWWEMGLLDEREWTGRWIGGPPVREQGSQPCPYLRRPFEVAGEVRSARLYVTALGLYELYLNGQRVGEDYFVPGWTDYHKRVEVLTYDVTGHVQVGENVLGAVLGDGWACGYLVWENHNRLWSEQPLLLAQLVLEYGDGTREVLATDATWQATTGPLLESDLYHGEHYDARLELPGWAEPGFDAGRWTNAHAYEAPTGKLVAKRTPPVRVMAELKPTTMTEPEPGVYIFDIGQNIVGWARLKVRGPAGTEIRLRFAERLNPDGTLYTEALRTARATDTYVLKGEGEEVYEPRFTFHGFQYAEVTGCPQPPTLDDVTGVILHNDLPQTGRFTCSDPLVNRLQQNILWGQKGNFLEVPTDCPQRDERLGWTGDAQVFVRTACFNLDVAPFFTKWLFDLEDAQAEDGAFPHIAPDVIGGGGAAAWADAGIICPWTLYLCYGDRRVLETHYAAMTRWVAYMERESRELIRPATGFGDWLATNAKTPDDAATPKDLIGTAYFAHGAALMAKIAGVLGRPDDAARFAALGAAVRAAFNHAFVTPSGRLVGHTQTGYLLALAFDLLPEEKRAAALGFLVVDLEARSWHLSTGFVGTPLLAPTLSRFGRSDVAYKLLTQDTYPSWLFTVKQGATTMWERWDGWTAERGFQDPGMNSFNHYAYGSIGEWLYTTVRGIDLDPERPGYKHVVIHPESGGELTSARLELTSPYGLIESRWHLSGERFTLHVSLPVNTTATLTLPAASPEDVREGGQPLEVVQGVGRFEARDGCVALDLGSGSYTFEARASPHLYSGVGNGRADTY